MVKNKALGSFTTLLDDWKTSFSSRMTKSSIQKEVPIGNSLFSINHISSACLPTAGKPASRGWPASRRLETFLGNLG
jgi:hypothetical protein